MLLTIDSCRQQLELTRQAALLSLLRFEQKWNPHGNNDAHLYEDMRNALVDANRHRVNAAKQQLLDRLLSFAYQCKTTDGMRAVTSPGNGTIRFKDTTGAPGGGWDYRAGKTGKIPCLNGFTAEVRLIRPG